MGDIVEDVLRETGPCVSGRLLEEIVERHGISYDAARQRLSRNKTIKRLAYLPFPKKARFLYFQSDYGSSKFWHALASSLLQHTVGHGGALAALLARDELIPLVHFSIACGSPIAQKGHLSPTTILEILQRAGLIQTTDIPGIGLCVQLSQQEGPAAYKVAKLRARLKTEEILLLAIKDWTRKLGLVSYDKVKLREDGANAEQPRVGTFHWDLTAPTYLAPMVNWSGDKLSPGFLVCDVLLGRKVSPVDLKPFLNKCRTLRNLKGVNRCLQIFVAEDYHPDARRLAKEAGIVPATPESLFGEEVAKSLSELTSVLEDVFNDTTNTEKIYEIFSRLSRIEGVGTNLRGTLFEYLVADIVRRNSPGNIRMNEIFNDGEGGKAEVDVLVVNQNQSCRFIECKGYKPGGVIPDPMVKKWLDKIQIVRGEALLNRFWRGHKLEFEFWTTGSLSQGGKDMIEKAQRVSPDKYTINVYESDGVQLLAEACRDKQLMDTLNEHFFEHPMETADRDIERRQRRLAARAAKVRASTPSPPPTPG